MIEGLSTIMEALKDVSSYAAMVAALYLVLELLKVGFICAVFILPARYGFQMWKMVQTEPRIVTVRFKQGKNFISEEVGERYQSFLKSLSDSGYIHDHHVTDLITAWKEYKEKEDA